jgi:hypothetical protein
MSRDQHDVIIIGGGPAGSTAASLLARMGHDVILFEKEKFPREHVGESLLPFCHALFADLGVLPELERRFVRKPGVRFIDRHGQTATTWCFGHVIEEDAYLSFQVIRSEFDELLLNRSRQLGAEVREQTKVKEVDVTTAPNRVRVVTVDTADHERAHHARFLIDASGRDAVLGTKNGWRKPRAELDRTAIWSHWGGVTMQAGLEEGLSLICYVGEEKKGWIWVFPLGANRITAGFVAQNAYLKDARKRWEAQGSTDWKQDLLMDELRQSDVVRAMLQGAKQALPVQVNGNYSYEVTRHYGSNYAMIGDARGFIDPIFSSGVFLSMKTAFLVAPAVHRQLTEPINGDNEELAEAYRRVTGAYGFVHRMIRLFYDPHAVTWAEAGASSMAHKQHESALAAGHYMLSGDFFEHHERYNRMFGLLEDPKKFRNYQRIVVAQPKLIDSSCHVPWDVAFGGMADMDAQREKAPASA